MKLTAWRLPLIAGINLLTGPTASEAHSPIEGLGTFYSYFLHPLTVPAHALLLASVALMIGQPGRATARIGLAGLTFGLAIGFLLVAFGSGIAVGETPILACALIAGILVSANLSLHTALCVLMAALSGALIALGSELSGLISSDAFLAVPGLAAGVLFMAVVVTGSTTNLAEHWQRVGMRITGSWIAAASLLALTLALKGDLE